MAGFLIGHDKEVGICSDDNERPIEILRRGIKQSDLYLRALFWQLCGESWFCPG